MKASPKYFPLICVGSSSRAGTPNVLARCNFVMRTEVQVGLLREIAVVGQQTGVLRDRLVKADNQVRGRRGGRELSLTRGFITNWLTYFLVHFLPSFLTSFLFTHLLICLLGRLASRS